MRLRELSPEFVEYIPDRLEEGVFYISERFKTCSHLCCCGCGEEVVTPLSAAEWALTKHGEKISLWPSIGNWDYACRSHYVIDRNIVRWAEQMTPGQIAAVKRRDTFDLRQMIAARNDPSTATSAKPVPWWRKAWKALFG